MQIWTSNNLDLPLYLLNLGVRQEFVDVAWPSSNVPDELPTGSLLRLGPVLYLQVDTHVSHLLVEFKTTMESILQANPDFPTNVSIIPQGSSICILPDICSMNYYWA
mmetsp:Transcript_34214/g.77030  ORF Transcript_34214/g.77030 Transcript_34214/m.77030 type:complete len:107 (-) Transcript_34214:50-370(-)